MQQNINQLSEELEQLLIDFSKKRKLKVRLQLSIVGIPLSDFKGEAEQNCFLYKSKSEKGKHYFMYSKNDKEPDLVAISFFSQLIKFKH